MDVEEMNQNQNIRRQETTTGSDLTVVQRWSGKGGGSHEVAMVVDRNDLKSKSQATSDSGTCDGGTKGDR
ncbi:hypothetical protein U1Q18_020541 [Sarracenia purpurea var. burkii]